MSTQADWYVPTRTRFVLEELESFAEHCIVAVALRDGSVWVGEVVRPLRSGAIVVRPWGRRALRLSVRAVVAARVLPPHSRTQALVVLHRQRRGEPAAQIK